MVQTGFCAVFSSLQSCPVLFFQSFPVLVQFSLSLFPVLRLDFQALLMNPPPHADPQLAAKEGIRLCQFLVKGAMRDSQIGKMSLAEAKKVVNKAIKNVGGRHKARSVT